jgi:hypothetical protein
MASGMLEPVGPKRTSMGGTPLVAFHQASSARPALPRSASTAETKKSKFFDSGDAEEEEPADFTEISPVHHNMQ